MSRDFDGSSGYLEAQDSAVWDATDDLTVAGWFKPDDIASLLKTLISRWDESSGKRVWAISFNTVGNGSLRFDTSPDGSFVGGNQADGGGPLTQDVWNHVVATHDSANTRNRIYTAGSLNVTQTGVSAGLFDTDIPVRIGGSPQFAGSARYFDGKIAEVGIWNVVLTDAEITALAKGISPSFIRRNSLIAYWPIFGNASPEPDWSGSGNNPTVNGTAPGLSSHPSVGRIAPYGGSFLREAVTLARASQVEVEVVVQPDSGKARVSQEVVEVIVSPTSGKARTSQVVIETISPAGGAARLSQAVVEVLMENVRVGHSWGTILG